MKYNITQAADAVGIARSTLNRDIKQGKISLRRDGKGKPYLEVAELERVYGEVKAPDSSDTSESVQKGQVRTEEKDSSDSALRREIELLRERLDDKDATIDDLRRRLDTESEERRKTQAQLTALLTDQRETKREPSGFLSRLFSPLLK